MTKTNNTKQQIIDAAMQLFWENSYESVGTNLICKTANIRKGSLYHFFPSKEDLAIEVMNQRWLLFENQILKLAFDKQISPLKRFDRFTDIIFNVANKVKNKSGYVYGCPFGNFISELSTQKVSIRNKIDNIFEQYMKYFEDSLIDAVKNGYLVSNFDTKITATILFATIQGSVIIAKSKNDPQILRNNFKKVIDELLVKQALTA